MFSECRKGSRRISENLYQRRQGTSEKGLRPFLRLSTTGKKRVLDTSLAITSKRSDKPLMEC
jgi:hypothetical protein